MNFLEETLKKLNEYGKQECNVVSVGNDKYRISWDVFKKNANFDYDSGFGGHNICCDLKIYGDDFIMFRYEYDGSEWWEVINIPRDNHPNINNKNISFLKGEQINYEEHLNSGINEEEFSDVIENKVSYDVF